MIGQSGNDAIIIVYCFTLIESPSITKATTGKGAVANIDDFVPEEVIDANFLTEEGNEDQSKLVKSER